MMTSRLAPLLLMAASAGAEPLADIPLDQLKNAYLECARVAEVDRLDMRSAARCGAIGEALLVRGFGGDLDALLAWWHSARGSETRRNAQRG